MEDRKYDRRCDTGSAFPLRTSTNQPTRSMASVPAVPVLMKSSSTKSLLDEVSEKRRRESLSHQLRVGPSLPSKSLVLGALQGSRAATASDLPTITGKKPLPKALLPKEARKSSCYQSLISGPFAFTTGLGVTAGPVYGMQRRSSISTCYPLRPGAGRTDRVSNGTTADTDSKSKENRLQTIDDATWLSSQDRARRNSVNTLSPPPPPTDVPTTQISLSRGRTSFGGDVGGRRAVAKQSIDTESIYPMLRKAFGKDEKEKDDDENSTVIRRNPDRQGAGRKERPVSYADPQSFQKMQQDLQIPDYVEYPPSHDPPPAPTNTSFDPPPRPTNTSFGPPPEPTNTSFYPPPRPTNTSFYPPPEPTNTSFNTRTTIARSESSFTSTKTPSPQDHHHFENTSNATPLPTSTVKPSNTISEDQASRVPRLSEEYESRNNTTKLEALSPSASGLKFQSPISSKQDDVSPNATEPKIKSPVTLKTETTSPSTAEPNIQSPSGSTREGWYSPIPASPRRVIKSPLLSSGSQERAELFSPAYRSSSTTSKDSPFENTRKPRPEFNFDIESNSRSVRIAVKRDETESYTSPDADESIFTEENNNTPPELPSSAPPPLPLASHPLGAPAFSPSMLYNAQDHEDNGTPADSIPDNFSSERTRDLRQEEVETIAPPTLPSSAPPPLPVTPPPASAPDLLPSALHRPDPENDIFPDKTPDNWSSNKSTNDCETIPENDSFPDKTPDNWSSNKSTNDCETIESASPALSCSPSPSLSVISHPADVEVIIPPQLLHQTDLEYSSSSSSDNETSDEILENSNKATNDYETIETAAPELSRSPSPSLSETSLPAEVPVTPPPVLLHTDLEYSNSNSNNSNTSDENPEICSNKATNDSSPTGETSKPELPTSAPPPLPVISSPPPPALNDPIIPLPEVHQDNLEQSSISVIDGYFNEAAAHDVPGAAAERENDATEQTESLGDRLQRQSVSSEESLLIEGQETKSTDNFAAENRETLSPTLSDADSGIDSVKLEKKRNCETNATNEEYQTAVWDEHNEAPTAAAAAAAAADRFDGTASPVSNDPNITDATSSSSSSSPSTDATLSNVNPTSAEPQQVVDRNASPDCAAMSSADVLPLQIAAGSVGSVGSAGSVGFVGSERNEESISIKTVALDKDTDASTHNYSQNVEDTQSASFSECDRKTSSDELPLDPLPPPSADQISTVRNESSEKSDVTVITGQRKLKTVHIQKGILGLGFSVQGGKGSAYGDKPLTVKKIFKAGDESVKEMLNVGDELISANGKDLTICSLHEAWNYLKTLPDGTIELVIGKASDL